MTLRLHKGYLAGALAPLQNASRRWARRGVRPCPRAEAQVGAGGLLGMAAAWCGAETAAAAIKSVLVRVLPARGENDGRRQDGLPGVGRQRGAAVEKRNVWELRRGNHQRVLRNHAADGTHHTRVRCVWARGFAGPRPQAQQGERQ